MLNTIISEQASYIINPTINLSSGVGANLPLFYVDQKSQLIISLVKNCVRQSQYDWDCFETSWDFKKHPMI